MRYYYSGLPYSDSLYHHGINGMKWGQRRYQNPDGSLTTLGRVHYGVGKAREKIGESAKVVGRTGAKAAKRLGEGVARGVKTRLAKRLPFMLNDEELKRYRERAQAETAYYNDLGDRRAAKKRSKGEQFFKNLAKDVISNSTKTAATKLVNKWADEKLKTNRERELEDIALKRTKYELSQKKADSELNEIKAKMNSDVMEQAKDKEKKRKMDDEIQKAKDKIDEFDRNMSGITFTDEQKERIDANRQKLVRDKQRIEKKYKKEMGKIEDRISKRERSLDERRSMLDTTLKDQQIRTMQDIWNKLGKDKKNSAFKDLWSELTDEEKAVAMRFINSST